jgi:hypothetical protein
LANFVPKGQWYNFLQVEKMSAHDPVQKEMAREKIQERMTQAELNKQEANSTMRHRSMLLQQLEVLVVT